MGRSNTASGISSVAEGAINTASGNYSTSMGYGSIASGNYSTTIGDGNVASGDYSVALGSGCEAQSDGSVALGSGCIASTNNQVAMGRLNLEDNSALVVVGNGVPSKYGNVRSNALTLSESGDLTIGGDYINSYGDTLHSVSQKVVGENPVITLNDEITDCGTIAIRMGKTVILNFYLELDYDIEQGVKIEIGTVDLQPINYGFDKVKSICLFELRDENDEESFHSVGSIEIDYSSSSNTIYVIPSQSETLYELSRHMRVSGTLIYNTNQ